MYALKSETMHPTYSMLKSIGLLAIYYLFSTTRNLAVVLGLINVKIVLEYLGSIAAFSTVAYNTVKTWELVYKYYLAFKYKRKRKKDIKPVSEDIDQFD